jgi:hypothetical protein
MRGAQCQRLPEDGHPGCIRPHESLERASMYSFQVVNGLSKLHLQPLEDGLQDTQLSMHV